MTRDYLRAATMKNYTAWDLNCRGFVRVRNRQKLEARLKRAARRTIKQELKQNRMES